MSSHTSDPIGDPSPDHLHPDLVELDRSHDSIADGYFEIDPALRDANRHLRDVFGPCGHSESGDWVHLDGGGNVVIHGGLAGLRRLAERCRIVAADVEGGEWERRDPSPRADTFWVSGQYGSTTVDPVSPHLPTGAKLRDKDNRNHGNWEA